jgi:hypothetical protein
MPLQCHETLSMQGSASEKVSQPWIGYTALEAQKGKEGASIHLTALFEAV